MEQGPWSKNVQLVEKLHLYRYVFHSAHIHQADICLSKAPSDPPIQEDEEEKRGRSPTPAEKVRQHHCLPWLERLIWCKEPLRLSDRVPSLDKPSDILSDIQQIADAIEASGLLSEFLEGLPDPEDLEVGMEIEPVIPVVQEPTPPSLLAGLSPSSSYATAADLDESDQTELVVPPGQPTISISPPTPPLSEENEDEVPPVYHASPASTTSIPPHPDLSTMINDPSVRLPSARPHPPKSFVAVAASVRPSPSNPPFTSFFLPHAHIPSGDGSSKRHAVAIVDIVMPRFELQPGSIQLTMHGSDTTITITPPTPPQTEKAVNARCQPPPRRILPSRRELSMMLMNNPWNGLPIPSPPPSPLLAVPRSARPLPLAPISVRLFHPYAKGPIDSDVAPCGDDPFEMTPSPSLHQPQLLHGLLSPMDAIRNPRGDWSPHANSERHAESSWRTVSQTGLEPITPPVVRHSRIVTEAWRTRSRSPVSTLPSSYVNRTLTTCRHVGFATEGGRANSNNHATRIISAAPSQMPQKPLHIILRPQC